MEENLKDRKILKLIFRVLKGTKPSIKDIKKTIENKINKDSLFLNKYALLYYMNYTPDGEFTQINHQISNEFISDLQEVKLLNNVLISLMEKLNDFNYKNYKIIHNEDYYESFTVTHRNGMVYYVSDMLSNIFRHLDICNMEINKNLNGFMRLAQENNLQGYFTMDIPDENIEDIQNYIDSLADEDNMIDFLHEFNFNNLISKVENAKKQIVVYEKSIEKRADIENKIHDSIDIAIERGEHQKVELLEKKLNDLFKETEKLLTTLESFYATIDDIYYEFSDDPHDFVKELLNKNPLKTIEKIFDGTLEDALGTYLNFDCKKYQRLLDSSKSNLLLATKGDDFFELDVDGYYHPMKVLSIKKEYL